MEERKMKFTLRSHDERRYASVDWHDSRVLPGVRYAIRKISLGQRIELNKKARELTQRYDFLKSGNSEEQLDAGLSELLVEKLYLEWGLVEIQGLHIDNVPATTELLIDRGPETLAKEILADVHAQLTLSEEDRKNS